MMTDFDTDCPRCRQIAADPLAALRAQTPAPAPTAPPPPAITAHGIGQLVGGVLVIMFLVFGLLSCLTGSRSGSSVSTDTPDVKPEIHPTVAVLDGKVIIRNDDAFDWSQVEMTINYHGSGTGYTYRTGALLAGQGYSLGVGNFANADGQRFSSLYMKVNNLCVDADTPTGRAYWSGTLREGQ
jgi:hypothetical protein